MIAVEVTELKGSGHYIPGKGRYRLNFKERHGELIKTIFYAVFDNLIISYLKKYFAIKRRASTKNSILIFLFVKSNEKLCKSCEKRSYKVKSFITRKHSNSGAEVGEMNTE